ncbi:hypothetical protein SEA_MILDRED21_202 [Streptomyces phage Mildred21]|uniref:Uncharacterized protein n=1 Tax=Streptomyces phage Mildred21 TaxID=2023959 RepID=A0A222YUB5_9CAUD|nr:hypothetical protein FDI35_gp114 [Streptomyces phage Mildred21]ASR75564.1 hypothetical protein SEA_MILDRED21_202 [Streptomyces phage Mildred21]
MKWLKLLQKKENSQEQPENPGISIDDILNIPGIDDEIDRCVCAEDFLALLEKHR